MDQAKTVGIHSFLDFKLLIERWKELEDISNPRTCLYHDYLSRIQKFPALLEDKIDPLILNNEENKLGFRVILSSLIPLSGQDEKKILAISKPFDYNPIYATPAFTKQFLAPDQSALD